MELEVGSGGGVEGLEEIGLWHFVDPFCLV